MRIKQLVVRPRFGVRFWKPVTNLWLAATESLNRAHPGSAYARFRLPPVTSPEKPVTFLPLTTAVRLSLPKTESVPKLLRRVQSRVSNMAGTVSAWIKLASNEEALHRLYCSRWHAARSKRRLSARCQKGVYPANQAPRRYS